MNYLFSNTKIVFTCICWFILTTGCKFEKNTQPALFDVLDATKTGLHFTNTLTPTPRFNIFNYLYFYNGGGVSAADFNNDGLIDLFFTASQSQNKLYLNKGKLQFIDITTQAKIPQDSAWSTGVSVVDINNDGLLDLYICRVGKHKILQGQNQFLICQGIDKNGIPFYKDQAAQMGLAFSGFSTQASFFDADLDGDLDMYLMNHSTFHNNFFAARAQKLATRTPFTGDRLYRNDGNKFIEITEQAGINSCIIGYGLGIATADINLDGYPDMYIGNDFNENDYLYINQRNGTFKDELTKRIKHTSQSTMGVDIADINNDGFSDIFTADMQPDDPQLLRSSLGEDNYEVFNIKVNYGYQYQYARNNVQLNRKNGMFSEVGCFTNLQATDWSWSPLWFDMDNDGLKDLFVSNGIAIRLTDLDYLHFVSNNVMQQKFANEAFDEKDLDYLNRFPKVKIANNLFKNDGNLSFTNLTANIKNNPNTYSNGAIYADLDNDGDLDMVVNNINDPVLVYKNNTNEILPKASVEVRLHGAKNNVNAIGTKIILFTQSNLRIFEKYPVRGFLSSMETPLHIGLHNTLVDSAIVIWPDNTYQRLSIDSTKKTITVTYKENLPKYNYAQLHQYEKKISKPLQDITAQTALNHVHQENEYNDFNEETLIPHMLSTEGPALAVADINKDGLEDLFMGSARTKKSVIYLQNKNGKFSKTKQPAIEADSLYEDVDACFTDVNNDGTTDLIVTAGGNEYNENASYPKPRLYLNDGNGNFTKQPNAFGDITVNGSCIITSDINNDGLVDLFLGGRSVAKNYGEIPQSYILVNSGNAKFINTTEKYHKELSHIGFVTDATWADINNDAKNDLVISLEWGGIIAFLNKNGKFEKLILSTQQGWWNFLLPTDVNNDGKIDFIAGNLGLNSRIKATEKEPLHLYFTDFDANGRKEQFFTYYVKNQEIPFASLNELTRQIPSLKKKFLYARKFARTPASNIFPTTILNSATTFTANYLSNSVLINKGNNTFTTTPLPWLAQFTSYRDAIEVDANGDNLKDILLIGNYYDSNIQMGRYDADNGTILINKGNGAFTPESFQGTMLHGQARHVSKIKIANKESFIISVNNDSTKIFQFK